MHSTIPFFDSFDWLAPVQTNPMPISSISRFGWGRRLASAVGMDHYSSLSIGIRPISSLN